MSFQAIFTPKAQADVDDAYLWYEQQSPGRGDEFLAELVSRVEEILRNPHLFPYVSRTRRGALLPRSKIIVYYRIERISIVITAVQHASADPRKWKRRR